MGLPRVVITGMGAVSSIGTGLEQIGRSLREGRSGVRFVPEWQELGLFSNVAGLPEAEPDSPLLDRKLVKTSTSNAKMALYAAWEAVVTAGLTPEQVRGAPIAVIVGSGTGSTVKSYQACERMMRHRTSRRVSAYTVPQVMGSTASANVSIALHTRGESWSVSSACTTGCHAIGIAIRLIRSGIYERVLAGASDELDWTRSGAFDAMEALSRRFNDEPQRASRPFDKDRDGFVIGGGAGIIMLEDLEHARSRDAPIFAEIIGYAANSDGHDMVAPLTSGAIAVIHAALADAGVAPEDVDYVNAHGTSTVSGDPSEAAAMAAVFGRRQPWISSTKSTTGHAIGAAGSLEVIFTATMLRERFLAPSRNVEAVDERCAHLRLVTDAPNRIESRIAISNSFGFGGTNACLVLRRWED